MEDGALGGAVGEQRPHAVFMRVAVMDLERQPRLLGQCDVGAECLPLGGGAARPGAEEVESGLPHGDDDITIGAHQVLEPGHGLIKGLGVVRTDVRVESVRTDLAHPGVQDGLVGMDRQGHAHPGQ